MEEIERKAQLSVSRATGFAGLGISCIVMAVSFDAVLALKVAAGLMGILCAYLVIRGYKAPTLNYKKTEVWILIGRKTELSQDVAQRAIGGALQQAYFENAKVSGFIAGTCWVMSIGVWLAL